MDYKEKVIALLNSQELSKEQKEKIESIFPELKESEDEKIRKWLIGQLKQGLATAPKDVNPNDAEKAIAWLEKQGEQNHVNNLKWDELTWEDINTLEEIINNVHYEFRNGIGAESFGKEVLERFREIKGDEYMELCKQKPAWSEEDNTFFKAIIRDVENIRYISEDAKKDRINWLKSLKERVQPQPNQEWSQNDIDMIDWLIRCCEKEHEELCNDRYGHQEIVSDLKRDCRKKWDWLESLKNKVVPKSHWKPSDEQMEALDIALSLAKSCGEESAFDLRTLYEQLKKLRDSYGKI